jgi:hypothetical protein
MKNNQKKSLPTMEYFLSLKPKRREFKWIEDEDGLIRLNVPKFKSNIGKNLCKLVKRNQYFVANMDKLGSIVWKNCDGKKAISEILKIIKNDFPNEENIEQRLILFLQQMKNLDYINY